MSAPKFEDIAGEYRELFARCKIPNGELALAAGRMVRRMESAKGKYELVALKMPNQMPWWVVALIHAMEAELSFSCHLHNGDPLRARTVHAPAGRPLGQPPFLWTDSAVDALRYDGLHRVPAERWSDVAGVLYALEGFNGWGYRPRGVRSPYLWAGSNLEQPGKFVADGKFDPRAHSEQIGAAVLLGYLLGTGAAVFRGLKV